MPEARMPDVDLPILKRPRSPSEGNVDGGSLSPVRPAISLQAGGGSAGAKVSPSEPCMALVLLPRKGISAGKKAGFSGERLLEGVGGRAGGGTGLGEEGRGGDPGEGNKGKEVEGCPAEEKGVVVPGEGGQGGGGEEREGRGSQISLDRRKGKEVWVPVEIKDGSLLAGPGGGVCFNSVGGQGGQAGEGRGRRGRAGRQGKGSGSGGVVGLGGRRGGCGGAAARAATRAMGGAVSPCRQRSRSPVGAAADGRSGGGRREGRGAGSPGLGDLPAVQEGAGMQAVSHASVVAGVRQALGRGEGDKGKGKVQGNPEDSN